MKRKKAEKKFDDSNVWHRNVAVNQVKARKIVHTKCRQGVKASVILVIFLWNNVPKWGAIEQAFYDVNLMI